MSDERGTDPETTRTADSDGAERGVPEASAEPDDAVEIFELLADETRWEIVRELAAHRRDNWRPEGRSFADLRRAVGVSDAGRFNYHLNELRGRFVEKRDDTYVLSNEGVELVGAVLAGAYDTSDVRRRGRTSRECLRCGESLEAVYELGYLRLECPTHGVVTGAIVPKRPAAERSLDDLVRIAGRWWRSRVGYAVDGVCPHCRGGAGTTVVDDPPDLPGLEDVPSGEMAFVDVACRDCGFRIGVPLHVYLVDHPAVVAFRHDCGDDQGGAPYLGTALSEVRSATLPDDRFPDVDRSDGPRRAAAAVAFSFEERRLVVCLDADATVIDAGRSREGDGES